MKNILNLTVILLSLNIYSQVIPGNLDPGTSGVLFRNKVFANDNLNIKGSKYIDKNFYPAEISDTRIPTSIRYNAFDDIIEFQTEDKTTYSLVKDETYKVIILKKNNLKYRLLNYTNNNEKIYGYLLEIISKNDLSLLKRQKVKLIAEKKQKSSYDTYTPAEYAKVEDSFYLEISNKELIPFPKNKKNLLKQFPEKSNAIEEFFKKYNDFDFKNEFQLITLTEYIASN